MPTPDVNIPVPKGAEHILIENGDTDARRVFSYFPYPIPTGGRAINMTSNVGLYRLEIDPSGKVTAVTILKTMGAAWDQFVMKKMITWRARPGGLRVVDMRWYYHEGYRNLGGGYH